MSHARWKLFSLPAAVVIIVIVSIHASFAQQDEAKPYAGQDTREIKALSAEEIQAYLNGQGMGFAKTAELNHYPGPRHVLDLAAPLQLTALQRPEIERLFNSMHKKAVRLGKLLVEKEQELNALFAEKQIDESHLQRATREIGILQGRLRAVHLGAHLEMRQILSPRQLQKYDQLRGYGAPTPEQHQQHQHPTTP